MAAMARIAWAALIGLAIAAGAPAAAHAGSRGGVPPPDVQRVFDEDAIPFIRAGASGEGGSPSVFEDVTGIENITELNSFTTAYLHGESSSPAYEPSGEWLGTIMADFVAVGTVRVWTPEGGEPEVAGFDGDGDLGGKLADGAGVAVVEDAPDAAFYAVFGDTIGPLNARAAAVLPEPTSLAAFQKIVVARGVPGGATDEESPGLEYLFGAGLLALAIGAAVLLSARVRARRSATGN